MRLAMRLEEEKRMNGFVWNTDRDRCVRIDRVREYTVSRFHPYQVFAILREDDYLVIHEGESFEASRKWLDEQIEASGK